VPELKVSGAVPPVRCPKAEKLNVPAPTFGVASFALVLFT